MAIHIIFGPGGSGKSLFQMLVIERQLRETRRNIVTNLAIDVPAFAKWLETKYPTEDLDPGRRIRLLTEAEGREFWKVRGNIRWTGKEYECEEDKGIWGVCYVIDEAGAAGFDASGWAAAEGKGTRGVACAWYLDQQRKGGDDVYASVNGRAPHGIAKPFRDKAHYFIRLKNGYLTSYGMFRARGRFQFFQYTQEPTKGTEPTMQGQFHFGTGIENCYRTEQGIGIIGTSADKGARAKGISPYWMVVGAALLAISVAVIPRLLGYGAQKFMAPDKPADVAPAAPEAPALRVPSTEQAPQEFRSAEEKPVDRVTGYFGGRYSVSWSDEWLTFEEAADTDARMALLVRFSGKRPISRPVVAQAGR